MSDTTKILTADFFFISYEENGTTVSSGPPESAYADMQQLTSVITEHRSLASEQRASETADIMSRT